MGLAQAKRVRAAERAALAADHLLYGPRCPDPPPAAGLRRQVRCEADSGPAGSARPTDNRACARFPRGRLKSRGGALGDSAPRGGTVAVRGLGRGRCRRGEATALVPRRVEEVGPWEWREPNPAVGLLIISGRMARGLHVDDARRTASRCSARVTCCARGASAVNRCRSPRRSIGWLWRSSSSPSSISASCGRPCAGRGSPSTCSRPRSSAPARSPTSSPPGRSHAWRRESCSTFWHLADRWGHVSPEGVVLELPRLTHEMIARMVAARRPSVTTGIRRLRELGVIEVRSRGRWVLRRRVEALSSFAGGPRARSGPRGPVRRLTDVTVVAASTGK